MSALRYIVNLEAAIVHADRYLMIVRSEQETHAPGALAVPGGAVETADAADDILEATLQREIREEVGIEVEPAMAYVESKLFLTDAGAPVVDIVFLCRYRAGVPVVVDPAEVGWVGWLTLAEALAHPKMPPWTCWSLTRAERQRVQLGW